MDAGARLGRNVHGSGGGCIAWVWDRGHGDEGHLRERQQGRAGQVDVLQGASRDGLGDRHQREIRELRHSARLRLTGQPEPAGPRIDFDGLRGRFSQCGLSGWRSVQAPGRGRPTTPANEAASNPGSPGQGGRSASSRRSPALPAGASRACGRRGRTPAGPRPMRPGMEGGTRPPEARLRGAMERPDCQPGHGPTPNPLSVRGSSLGGSGTARSPARARTSAGPGIIRFRRSP